MTLDLLLEEQRGLVTRRQALAAGLPPEVVDGRVRRRQWVPVLPCVYRTSRAPARETEVRVRAAVLWAGEGAVLVGAAAAWWHRMIGWPPTVVRVGVAHRRRRLVRAGVEVGTSVLAQQDVTMLDGLAVTAAARTVLEAAVELGGAPGRAVVARWVHASTDGRADGVAALWSAQQRMGAGSVVAAALLRDLRHSEDGGPTGTVQRCGSAVAGGVMRCA